MNLTRIMIATLLVGGLVLAGCGGKKAMEEPAPTDVSGTPVEQPPTETPIETPDNSATDLSPVALSDVFFDFDQYNLSGEGKGTLEANARELKRVTEGNITIEGHCDSRGTKAYNLALGEKRANAARDYLIALGVSASRITTISYGKERPFDTGDNEAAWAKNRRAHFVTQ